MALIPWKGRGDGNGGAQTAVTRLRNEMDDLLGRFLGDSPLGMGGLGSGWPRMDLAESDKEITVTAELPGVDPKEIEINVTGNVLTLRGEKKGEREEKTRDYHYVERQYGSFHRSVQLPTSVESDKVDATYKDGVLTIKMSKHPEARPRKITVRGG
jgi:HSP20 family protein